MAKTRKTAFLLAAAQSGAGKTTMSIALMAGFDGIVQPFKVGPDYIDPMYHQAATGRASRNLDSYMLSEDTVKYLFRRQMEAADAGIVEGVMGLYDGITAGGMEGSSAHMAQILDLPVVLLLDPQGMSMTMAAIVQGLRNFSPQNRFAGVILNQIKSEAMYLYAKKIIEDTCKLPVFGYLPRLDDAGLDSRHLGLVCSGEVRNLTAKIKLLGETARKTIDFAALAAAAVYREQPAVAPVLPAPLPEKVRIGVAKDAAFNFYYQDSLDLLECLGAALVPVSPLADEKLPPLDGLILGGGYPEVNAAALSANRRFMENVRDTLEAGLPCFAECGGFLYLGKTLTYQGEVYEMTGFYPYDFMMTDRLQRFGYMEATLTRDTILGPPGNAIRGHEFHYTKMAAETEDAGCYRVQKPGRQKGHTDGYCRRNTIAAYPHFHFWGNPAMAKYFLETAQNYREGRLEK